MLKRFTACFAPSPGSSSARGGPPAWDETLRSSIAAHGLVGGVSREPAALAAAAAAPPAQLAAAARRWMAADPICVKALESEPGAKEVLEVEEVVAARREMGAWPAEEESGDGQDDGGAEIVERGTFDGLFGGRKEVLRIPDKEVDGVIEDGGKSVKVYRNELFTNWGRTQKAVPLYTFVPVTRVGVVNAVRFAARESLKVRAAGTRHSWSDLFGGDGGVLISFVELDAAVPRTDLGVAAANPADNELEKIVFEGEEVGEDGVVRGRVRVGAAATSEHIRAWSLSENGGHWRWMLPALPVLTAITSAGVTQPICHGAGRRHPSCSDFVMEVEVVNCKGEVQVLKERELIRSASGGLGLFGVVLSQVFLMEPLKIAVLSPRRIPTQLAVPPVPGERMPEQNDFQVNYGKEDLERARERFVKECDGFYSEWFWFPFQEDCWVNVWNVEDNGDGKKPPEYLSEKEVVGQNAQLALLSALETTLMRLIPAVLQTRLLAALTMAVLPAGVVERIGVPDALHFQRGIHQLRVRDIELEIEIPSGEGGKPDFSICQRAWWAAINAIYEYERRGKAPVRVALEMRILGGSDVTLSTQRGNKHGTCSIEVLTNTLVGQPEWAVFRDEITSRWHAIASQYETSLGFFPHWAKEWPSEIGGRDIMDYMKKEYEPSSVEFLKHLSEAGRAGGYTEDESLRMFGNSTCLKILNRG